MGKRERIATVAAVSNGMVWFGLAVFVGAIAVQFAPSALAGEWFNILGWAFLVLAALGLVAMGIAEQWTMRAARGRMR
jgi:high-affinity Fe2+/Pb2+ permease